MKYSSRSTNWGMMGLPARALNFPEPWLHQATHE
jgi:hypothetical protein